MAYFGTKRTMLIGLKGEAGYPPIQSGDGGKYLKVKSTEDGIEYVSGGGGGENGATFTPSVSAQGIISWTNDKSLPNPQSVNIKGADGTNGTNGTNGVDGVTPHIGDNNHWFIGTTDTGITAIGQNGTNGTNGTNGVDGESAYHAAQQGGYTGTQADFYADLGAMDGLASELEALL